ncbi:hypothetical protein L9F63_020886, partial [Diploptera punctata]
HLVTNSTAQQAPTPLGCNSTHPFRLIMLQMGILHKHSHYQLIRQSDSKINS